MSIVEKALSKLHEAARSAVEPRAVEVATPRTTPQTAPSASAPVETKKVELRTAGQLAIDFAALQTASLLPPQQDALAVRNQFRRLKWPVLDEVAARRREGQECAGAVMVGSALPGEGKSFTTCNLALSIAREENYRVVLIDADVAKGHISDAFGIRNKPGLTDYLTNPTAELSDVLLSTSVDRLFVLSCGKFVSHVSELLSGARMQLLLKTLVSSGSGTIVLMDTSPVLATNEAQVLSRLVPQILLIVRADETLQPLVLEACNILGRDKISAVLNQAHAAFAGEPYHSGYGTYAKE